MYLVFTNQYRHNPYRRAPMMANRFAVHTCETKEQARQVVETVRQNGYEVTRITNELGYPRSL